MEKIKIDCPVVALARALIRCPSLSPNDAGCQSLLIDRLRAVGFCVENMDCADTSNFWAWHGSGETLAFAGHTDVVTAGDKTQWRFPPFTATLHDGLLFGRGAADMKGSLAAMIVAAERFVSQFPQHSGRLAFIITSDEEASAENGTRTVVERLRARKERLEYCLVGEPSSDYVLGDVIKIGRRGSLTAKLTLLGTQGHVAYPQLADNAIHRALPALLQLANATWDQGNAAFPPTTMQIVNVQAGDGSSNVIPGAMCVEFNFRFSTELSEQTIRQRVSALLDDHALHYHLEWHLSGQPFLTPSGKLVDAVAESIRQVKQIEPKLLTTGGTSDGRFIATLGGQVVELGPVNATIHKVDECVAIADLQQLSSMYQRVMENLLT